MKAIAILSDHPEAKIIAERMKQRETFFEKTIKGLKQKANDAHEKLNEENTPEHESLIELFKDKLPSDYSPQTYCVHFDLEKNLVECHKKGEGGDMPDFIKAILGTINPNDLQ